MIDTSKSPYKKNMKKTILITIAIWFTFSALSYLAVAFANLSLNPFYWSVDGRVGFSCLWMASSIISLIAIGVIANNDD